MTQKLIIYNTLSRKKEEFVPLHAPHVGMYVCGPTVYGDPHLGHARPAITFDILYRYLRHIGYSVRYVRNITDVGHLEHDADEGEDKIAKKARLEQLEPMEVVQYYTLRYHKAMEMLGVLPPSIEPHASGHIIEQEAFVQKILDAGYAYVSEGSVYFDVARYSRDHHYGILSGRNVEELLSTTRALDGQTENPHHECEIAQSVAALGHPSVKYWMHNNMITIEGTKMGKSLGNFITLPEFFNGNHPKLQQAYSPMTIRFFILQAHYRSTVDFSNEALQASEKGLQRLQEAVENIGRISPAAESTPEAKKIISGLRAKCYEAMNDDLNTPIVISHLFEAARLVNSCLGTGGEQLSAADRDELEATCRLFLFDLLGLTPPQSASGAGLESYRHAVDLLLEVRAEAKAKKDWPTADRIRQELTALGFELQDTKEGTEWTLNK